MFFRNNNLKKLLFGTYFSMDTGWGREFTFTLDDKKIVWRGDDGLIYYLVNRIDELENRIEQLETKKK